MKRFIPTALAVATVCGALASGIPSANAQDATARPKTAFNLGKAIQRAFLDNPRAKTNKLDLVNRVHYATTVYAYEGNSSASTKHEVVSSHGLFMHINLDSYDRSLKPDHVLAD